MSRLRSFPFALLAASPLFALTLPASSGQDRVAPPDARGARSEVYRVVVDGREVFTTKFRDVSYASFPLSGTAKVEVRTTSPVKRFNVSPHAAGIVARSQGNTLSFSVARPQHLVVTVNDSEKLFLFANAIATDAPRLGAAGVVNVLDFGVDRTGVKVDTVRLQRAIDEVAATRGTLYFPPGIYQTGTLWLKSNLRLHLAEGARLLGSANPDDYPADPGFDEDNLRYDEALWVRMGGVDVAYRRLLMMDKVQNVRITGSGTIDGQGKLLRDRKNIVFVMIHHSSDVAIEDVTLLDSPLYNIHTLGSDRLAFRRLKIVSDQSVANTDGIDPDSSRDVLIEDCFFHCADDCVSPKTSNHKGVKGDTERITVRGCVFLSRTAATKIGNETFGGTLRDITFENNDVLESDRAIVISGKDRYGFENIRLIDTRIEKLLPLKFQYPFQIHMRQRPRGGPTGPIRNVLIENLTVEEEYPKPNKIAGSSETGDVRGVRFVNFVVAGKVRLNAADANVEIGPFVSDVTFSAK